MTYKIILIFHVISGFTALTMGIVAMLTLKGSKQHIFSGKWFIIAMYLVGLSAIVMTILKFNSFLMAVGVFSLYLTFAGKQAITFYRRKTDYQVRLSDQLPSIIAMFTAIWMILYPVYTMISNRQIFVSILLVFGVILFINSIKDIYMLSSSLRAKPGQKIWLIKHIGMTGGAYIATSTAFLVTNIQLNPAWITWLTPTLIGTVILSFATKKWSRKFRIAN